MNEVKNEFIFDYPWKITSSLARSHEFVIANIDPRRINVGLTIPTLNDLMVE